MYRKEGKERIFVIDFFCLKTDDVVMSKTAAAAIRRLNLRLMMMEYNSKSLFFVVLVTDIQMMNYPPDMDDRIP